MKNKIIKILNDTLVTCYGGRNLDSPVIEGVEE